MLKTKALYSSVIQICNGDIGAIGGYKNGSAAVVSINSGGMMRSAAIATGSHDSVNKGTIQEQFAMKGDIFRASRRMHQENNNI
jgi:hypothetical protein